MSEDTADIEMSADGNVRTDSKGMWGKAGGRSRVSSMINRFGGSQKEHEPHSRGVGKININPPLVEGGASANVSLGVRCVYILSILVKSSVC